jgi:tetracycline repressor-like protein
VEVEPGDAVDAVEQRLDGRRAAVAGHAQAPSHMAWLDRGLRALEDTALTEGDKAAVMLMLNGMVTWEARLTAELAPDPERVYAQVTGALIDAERFPALRRAAESGVFEDEGRETDFAFSLQIALDGVERLIQASK